MTNKKEKAQNTENKKAVAINYKKEDSAPKVIASGKGFVANNIIKKAKEHKVSVVKDEELVDELIKIDLGMNIPPELYEVVAEVLVFVGRVDKILEERDGKY